ncbi:unnamed protein product, partial [Coffea canephora]
MALNLRQKQTDCILRMLNLNQPRNIFAHSLAYSHLISCCAARHA